jgi:transcriptional regulator with XRE-family HTH domain
MKILGEYLRDKRKALNLSIKDVADKLNLAYSTVANMETGSKNPTLEQLIQYGLIFGCEWDEIITNAIKITNNKEELLNTELQEIVKTSGYESTNYKINRKNFDDVINEVNEMDSFLKDIKKEYDDETAAENLKINNSIEDAINTYIKRWTTKDTPPIDPKEITDFREEIVHLIGLRVQHLTSK